MFQAFRQLFVMFTTLFSAGELCAKSLHNLAAIGDEMSEGLLLKGRLERQAELTKLKRQLELDAAA